MSSSPVKIGPFSGGLNSYSNPTAVGDNECVAISNFTVDLDGSIFSRPPLRIKDTSDLVPGTDELKLLGFFIDTSNEKYLIAATSSVTYARKESDGTWAVATSTFGATCFVQYANKAYLIASPSSANPGGSWVPGTFTPITALPKGASAIVYKERLFVGGGKLDPTNANRVFFSNAADFATWNTSTNFFDVRSGDGQHIVKLAVFQDTILVFKEDCTYAFSYDSSPSRGAVRVINNAIGCSNIDCVVEYENSLYVHHESSVYQLSNWNFTLINLKVPFVYSNLFPGYPSAASLSILADQLIVHHYDSIYVFGLRTGAWTTWTVSETFNFNYFIKVPVDDASTEQMYYAGPRRNTAGANRTLFAWKNAWDINGPEEITASITTKAYDFNVPYTFKRLFWWGTDMLSKRNMTYVVHPITYTKQVTHQMMSAYTHASITGTHAQPLDISIDVTDSLQVQNVAGNRIFAKLLKALRFRQINFTISGTTDGSNATGPLRIFNVVAFVDNKQVVSNELN